MKSNFKFLCFIIIVGLIFFIDYKYVLNCCQKNSEFIALIIILLSAIITVCIEIKLLEEYTYETNKGPKKEFTTLPILHTLYAEAGNEIRHYSSTRSALTTFLIALSIAAFTTKATESVKFLEYIAWLFLISSALTCIYFSNKTQRLVIYYKKLKNILLASTPKTTTVTSILHTHIIPEEKYPLPDKPTALDSEVLQRMANDFMNIIFFTFVALTLWFIYCSCPN